MVGPPVELGVVQRTSGQLPQTEEQLDEIEKMLDKIEDDEDVQAVYTNIS